MKILTNILKKSYLGFILFFTYVPILVMIVLSFNSSKSRARWDGFTLNWYFEIFKNRYIVDALRNTILIALLSAFIATFIGTLAAVAINNMSRRRKQIYMSITNIPMLNADIVTGISLLLFFIAVKIPLSFLTILLSHITFNIPYVILSIMPRLQGLNNTTYEAALDLGASENQAFMKVLLPEIMPGVVSGFMLSITMSLDDFIITHFTRGAGVNTLSTYIYSQVRRGISPTLYALSSLIFIVILIVLVVYNILSRRKQEA